MPFSDPLADGPVIHAAGTARCGPGPTVAGRARGRPARSPSASRWSSCATRTRSSPAGSSGSSTRSRAPASSGLIVPDLPLEEARRCPARPATRAASRWCRWWRRPPRRSGCARIGARARGFLYTVSLTGTTGERAALDGGLAGVLARAAASTEVPVAVGFGIGTPEQARRGRRRGADGVIIGSRLVRAAGEADDPAGGRRLRELVSARSRPGARE